ncbi:MAG: S8 family serine peptidase [Xanthomonadaceae bacterium]|nr:S8 family serine peptidase [Xanthomonadaceae bacterium]
MRIARSFALLAAAVSAPSVAAPLLTAEKPIPGHYIVVFRPDAVRMPDDPATRARPDTVTLTASLANRLGLRVSVAYDAAVQGFAAQVGEKQLAALLADPRVAFVEQDAVQTIATVQQSPTWGLDRSDQRHLPLDASYTWTTGAANVRAYVIDTGIHAAHADFGNRVQAGYTAIADGRGSGDCNGHGTHVAGTIGGATWGVAKQALLVPVRVLNCSGSGTTSGVLAGIDWVTANHVKPAVANLSLGGSASTAIDAAVNRAISAGVTVVVAAGNSATDACAFSPARVPAAITVGATSSTDSRASFSNFGVCLDLFAPGQSITSAWHSANTATNAISGTSMAAPHVAGAAAVFLSANTGATPAAVANALLANATPNKVMGTGAGSPNRLLFIAAGGTAPPDNPPLASFTRSCTHLACTFDGRASSDDVGIASMSWTFGDGSSATGTTAARTFAAAGTYTVTLTVRDTANQATSASAAVTVTAPPNLPPSANFTWTCSNLTCTFNGASSTDDQGVVAYSWDFGDGATATGVSATRTYASFGSRTVTLTVRDAGNLTGTRTATVTTVSSATAPCTNCTLFTGALPSRGTAQYAPGTAGYTTTVAGTHTGYLVGPATGADFNLVLERWNGSAWIAVAFGYAAGARETVTFFGAPGTYRWRTDSIFGSGAYQLWMVRP